MGAVAALQRVKNPILVARKVMEETDHVMLAGEGAQRFARAMGFGDHDPVTAQRRADWEDKKRRIAEVLGPKSLNVRRFLREHPAYSGGTVGAAAVDALGRARGGDLHRRRHAEARRPRRRHAHRRAPATTPPTTSPPRPRAPANT